MNFWISEFIQIHNQKARVIEVTREQDPEQYLLSRLANMDLRWRSVGRDLFQNELGVKGLTFNAGVGTGSALPTAAFLRFLDVT